MNPLLTRREDQRGAVWWGGVRLRASAVNMHRRLSGLGRHRRLRWRGYLPPSRTVGVAGLPR